MPSIIDRMISSLRSWRSSVTNFFQRTRRNRTHQSGRQNQEADKALIISEPDGTDLKLDKEENDTENSHLNEAIDTEIDERLDTVKYIDDTSESGRESDATEDAEVETDGLKWQLIGTVEDLQTLKNCNHVYSEAGKKEDLVLIRVQHEYHALSTWCTHRGGPLHNGDIEDCAGRKVIRCPWHNMLFDVNTGEESVGVGLKQEVHPVQIKDEKVYIKHKSRLSLQQFSS